MCLVPGSCLAKLLRHQLDVPLFKFLSEESPTDSSLLFRGPFPVDGRGDQRFREQHRQNRLNGQVRICQGNILRTVLCTCRLYGSAVLGRTHTEAVPVVSTVILDTPLVGEAIFGEGKQAECILCGTSRPDSLPLKEGSGLRVEAGGWTLAPVP